MGSFDMGCGISGATVHYGDPAGVILLTEPEHCEPQGCFGLFHTYPQDLFHPYLPPVRGIYDDYGNLTDIVPSATTAYLERTFGKPVEVILACVSNYDRHVHSQHGPVFEHYENTLPKETLKKATWADLGFTEVEENHLEFGNWTVQITADGSHFTTWEVQNKNTSRQFLIEGRDLETMLEKFSFKTGVVPGFKAQDWKAILTLRKLRGMYFHGTVFDKMVERLHEYEDTWQSRVYALDSLRNYLTALGDIDQNHETAFVVRSMAQDGVRDWNRLSRASVTMVEEVGESALADMQTLGSLHTIMGAVNRMYMPSICGEQHGNDRATLALSQIMGEIAQAEVEQYEY